MSRDRRCYDGAMISLAALLMLFATAATAADVPGVNVTTALARLSQIVLPPPPPPPPPACPVARTGRDCRRVKPLPKCFAEGLFNYSWFSLHRGAGHGRGALDWLKGFSAPPANLPLRPGYLRGNPADRWTVGRDVSLHTVDGLPLMDVFGQLSLPVKSCALVGSGGYITRNRDRGRDIDAHTVVVRLEDAPTVGYETAVGARTTLRIARSPDEVYRESSEAVLVTEFCSRSELTAKTDRRSCGRSPALEKINELKVHAMNPAIAEQWRAMKAFRTAASPPLSLLTLMLLVNYCQKISVYGFRGGGLSPVYCQDPRDANMTLDGGTSSKNTWQYADTQTEYEKNKRRMFSGQPNQPVGRRCTPRVMPRSPPPPPAVRWPSPPPMPWPPPAQPPPGAVTKITTTYTYAPAILNPSKPQLNHMHSSKQVIKKIKSHAKRVHSSVHPTVASARVPTRKGSSRPLAVPRKQGVNPFTGRSFAFKRAAKQERKGWYLPAHQATKKHVNVPRSTGRRLLNAFASSSGAPLERRPRPPTNRGKSARTYSSLERACLYEFHNLGIAHVKA